MRTYADAFPMRPLAVGGPNEGVGNIADGRGTDPSFETHKSDLSAPGGYVSSWEKLRAFSRRRVVRIVAATAFTLAGATACAGQSQGGETAATAEATTGTGGKAGTGAESIAPECYAGFANLDAKGQEDCRALVAQMELDDVEQLQGLDKARWASYYRHAALGEQGVLHNVVRSKVIDDPSGAESAALHFLTNYQASVYRLAWLMQTNDSLAHDPRTLHALLGSDDTDSDAYKMAAHYAEHIPTAGQTADTYIQTTGQASSLFASVFAENIKNSATGEGRTFSFTATLNTVSGTPGKRTLAFHLHPYMEAHPDQTGGMHEKPDDPNAPGAELFARLGTPLLAEPAQISAATA
jgi:hypothetical protein